MGDDGDGDGAPERDDVEALADDVEALRMTRDDDGANDDDDDDAGDDGDDGAGGKSAEKRDGTDARRATARGGTGEGDI